MRILIIEDNQKLAHSLKRGFEQEGYATDCAFDGAEGEKILTINGRDYDAVVLDISLPIKDGLELCRIARKLEIMTPIIMLTARDTVDDKITGLDYGADDYMVKPFSFEELLSRIRALARRPRQVLRPVLEAGGLSLDSARREVFVSGRRLDLTLTEFRLLELFMRNSGKVIDRQKIIDSVWDSSFNIFSRAMDVHINNLRGKLGKATDENIIETIRGVGYKLKA
ncbi:response regulator transcription factor [Patescibacteria group bacterium]|nr:response regulator transcription factor [Patescibacteria group bacterium]MDE1946704.1 response regulator transcription factor [Patescibacteria group bacterium]MDE2010993.1 response regulator transcription factor [Patescibacteria group bacterium]MDE2232835.1 response regulator transcription factor [Patescibacteria group bacterium]